MDAYISMDADISILLRGLGCIIISPIVLPALCVIKLYEKRIEYLQRRKSEECIVKLSKYIDYEICENRSNDFCIEMVKDHTMFIIVDSNCIKSAVCNSIKSGFNNYNINNYLILIIESDNINYDRIYNYYNNYKFKNKNNIIKIINPFSQVFDIQNEMIVLNGYYGIIGGKFNIEYIRVEIEKLLELYMERDVDKTMVSII